MKKWLTAAVMFAFIVSANVIAEKPLGDKSSSPTSKSSLLLDKEKIRREASDNRFQVILPRTGRQVPQNILETQYLKEKSRKARGDNLEIVSLKGIRSTTERKELSKRSDEVLFDLKHVDDVAEYYLGSGAANDTFAVVFTSAAPAEVMEVYYQWYGAGNMIAFAADYDTLCRDSVSATGQSQNVSTSSSNELYNNISPIGTWRTTPTPNSTEGAQVWEALDIGGTFVVGDSNDVTSKGQFIIAVIKGGEKPYPLADATDDQGGITYTWFGGPWTTPDTGAYAGITGWGRYSSEIENMCLVKVAYRWGAPIAVLSINQLPNTYSTGQTLPIYVDLLDDVDETTNLAIDENDTLMYFYTFQDSTYSGSLTAFDVGATGNGIYTFDVVYSGAMVDDEIQYWVAIKDNEGLESESIHLGFTITEPVSPAADLLIIGDSESNDQADWDLYRTVVDEAGLVYEYWNTSDQRGIDASVINYGWTNIFVYGWGNKTVPVLAEEDDPGYAEFLDNGGNLLLVDQDWLFGHGYDQYPPAETFAAGDFAYDYFGLSTCQNDPEDDPVEHTSYHGDTLNVWGIGLTSIDAPFETDPMVLNHTVYGTQGWTDIIEEGLGTAIFMDDDGNFLGVTHSGSGVGGTWNTVYLAFMADAAGDTLVGGEWDYTKFATLLNAVIEYFGVVSPPVVDLIAEGSTRYGVASGTTTATVNAEAVDGDGTVESIYVYWTLDGGVTVDSLAMTDLSGGFYTASISPTGGFTDTSEVIYWVEATDNIGLKQASKDWYFWGTDFTPTTGVNTLYMFDYYAAYVTYGPSTSDSILTANMDSAGMVYDYWDVWDYGQADYMTVLSNYDRIVYLGVYDWFGLIYQSADHTLTEFVDGGGILLYSSEEYLWVDQEEDEWSPEPGTFAYDVLGVEWALLDVGTDTVWAYDDGNTGFLNSVSDGDIVLDPSIDYFGSMADWVDPLHWGEPDQLASPFLGNGPEIAPGSAYYNSVINDNVIFLAFNLPMLPDSVQEQLLTNFMTWDGTVSVDEGIAAIPTSFDLHQNYPNPFNPVTNLQFDLPEGSDVKLVIYNLLGQKVTTLMNRNLQAGYHNVLWNGRDAFGNPVGSGVYIYRMTAGDFTNSKKMLLLK